MHGLVFYKQYGLNAVFNHPETEYPTLKSKVRLKQFFSTFLVVFLNPATFVLFTGFFTLFGVAKEHFDLFDSMEIALCVFIGSITFWIVTSHLILQIRGRFERTLANSK